MRTVNGIFETRSVNDPLEFCFDMRVCIWLTVNELLKCYFHGNWIGHYIDRAERIYKIFYDSIRIEIK